MPTPEDIKAMRKQNEFFDHACTAGELHPADLEWLEGNARLALIVEIRMLRSSLDSLTMIVAQLANYFNSR